MKAYRIAIVAIVIMLLSVGIVSAAQPGRVSGYSNGHPFITFFGSNIQNPTGTFKVNVIIGNPTPIPNNATIGDNTITNVPVVVTYFVPYRTVALNS